MDSLLVADLEGAAPVIAHLITLALPDRTVRWVFEGGFVMWDEDLYAFTDEVYGNPAMLGEIEDGATENASPLDLGIICDTEALTALIEPEVQGSLVTVHLAAVSFETGMLVGEPELIARAELDQPSLTAGPALGLRFSCITEEARMLEPNEDQRLTDSFHKSVWPGELGFEHVTDIERKIYWRADDPNNAIS